VTAVALPAVADSPANPANPYAWHPHAADRLDVRFDAPAGFARGAVDARSFPAFLRALPLLPPGTPVLDYRGRTVRDGHDPHIAAVVDIDVGDGDLQQCADSVLRMHAEWSYGRGDRDVAYATSSGARLGYEGYLAGDRPVVRGNALEVRRSARPLADDHRAFRAYLDEVFAWASTGSLAHEGTPVAFDEVRAGDFFVMAGRPFGHAVLVLDVARGPGGRVALLLGQGYMPAQSFQVLSPGGPSPWFLVEPGATEVETPFWDPFPRASLRRLPVRTST
jgi:hypothetical protein